MTYYKMTAWDEPVLSYMEIGEDRWQARLLELFSDGRQSYADERHEWGTFLAKETWPEGEELAELLEGIQGFRLYEISREEFEKQWAARRPDWYDQLK